MSEITWLDYVTAMGAITTPVLVLILTGIGWRLRTRLERQAELEDKLREDRISTYNKILNPFVILLISDAAWQSDPKNRNKDKFKMAMVEMLSLDYRQQGFRLALVGSDSVVKSYNNLMQYFFQLGDAAPSLGEADVREIMALLGKFLLQIRKSMGNEATKLDHWDMMEWFISDARQFRHQ